MSRSRIVFLGIVPALVACASGAPISHIFQKNPNVTISSQELRVRVRAQTRPLAGIIETAADEIIAQSDDPAVRREALRTKTEALPALFDALFLKDPGAALIDASALVEQLRQEYTDGSNLILNDDFKSIILQAAEDMKQRLQSVYLATGASQEHIDLFWVQIEDWAREHPIKGNFAVRDSTAGLLAASNAVADGGLGLAISSTQDELADFAVRADLYATYLPRQSRWQAELLIEEMMDERIVARAVDQAGPFHLAIDHIPLDIETERLALIKDLRQEAFGAGQWIRAERIESLDFAAAERKIVLDRLTEEMSTVLQAITGERQALIEALDHQRTVAFEDLESIVSSALEQSRKGLIDHLFLRTAQLLAVVLPLLLLGGLILVWFARRGNR